MIASSFFIAGKIALHVDPRSDSGVTGRAAKIRCWVNLPDEICRLNHITECFAILSFTSISTPGTPLLNGAVWMRELMNEAAKRKML
jgi:hypothetical protein